MSSGLPLAALTFDQDVSVADVGLGFVGRAQSVLAVLRDDECFHDPSPVRGTREPGLDEVLVELEHATCRVRDR